MLHIYTNSGVRFITSTIKCHFPAAVASNAHARAGASVMHGHKNRDRKSTRLNSSHRCISYAVLCLKKKDTRDQALATVRRFIDDGAQAVKLEGRASHVGQIEAITQAGIPFMAQIGILPQTLKQERC